MHYPHGFTTMPETVVIATPDGRITAYDPYTGTVLARFIGTQSPRNGITVIGNNQFASSHVPLEPSTGAGTVHLYYWWSPSCARSIHLPEPVGPLASTSDGRYLFSGGISGQVYSSSVLSGELVRSVSAHEKPVSCVAISFDESLILSGSDDGSIAVTPVFMILDDLMDMKFKRFFGFKRFRGHELAVTGLTTYGSVMVSSSLDWTCKVWSVVDGSLLQTVRFDGEIMCAVLDPLEMEMYVSGMNGMVYKRKIKVEARKEVAKGGKTVVWGKVHDGGVVAMEMLDYGRSLLMVSEYGEICLWELEGGKMISSFSVKGGVSGVMVVKDDGWFGKIGIESGEGCGYGGGEEVGKAIKEVAEMEEAMKVVVEDRGRAINNFESAIEINEKLMELMLNEAKAIAKFDDTSTPIKTPK